MAAVANCHKLRGLKEHILVIVVLRIQSPKWVSLASNHGVGRMLFLLEASFSRLEAACPPWLMASAYQCELMRGWFSLSACISDTGLRPASTSKAPCNEMALDTARYSTSFPYLKAEWLGTLIPPVFNSHLSCVCPFRLLKQKHHRPGGSFFALCFLTEG